jgi:hypothetical protein
MRTGKEISWVLEGRSSDQIPMARLAEYMQQFAVMLGETENVHFARVEEGCTRLVAKLNPGLPAQRVHARVYAAAIDVLRQTRCVRFVGSTACLVKIEHTPASRSALV